MSCHANEYTCMESYRSWPRELLNTISISIIIIDPSHVRTALIVVLRNHACT